MPMPMPKPDESKKDFMDRCCSDPTMQKDYPDMKQCVAVCEAQWSKDRSADVRTERLIVPVEEWAVSLEGRADGQPKKIVGRAAVFYDPSTPGTEYNLFPDLKERIMPRAFNKALNERHDVRALFNHDPNMVLGRTTAGTLKLTKSLRGLDYEIDPPDTTYANDLKVSLARGDVTGSSFGFRVLEQKFKTEQSADGKPIDIREIHSVELLDVSPVTYPAYTAAESGLRSIGDAEEARAARDEWRKTKELFAAIQKQQMAARLAAINERAAAIE